MEPRQPRPDPISGDRGPSMEPGDPDWTEGYIGGEICDDMDADDD